MITHLYKKHVPVHLRSKIYRHFISHFLFFIQNFNVILKSKLIYLLNPFLPSTKENKAYAFMGRYGVSPYIFRTSVNYKKIPIRIYTDKESTLPFIVHNGKKLFFPESFSENTIINTYRNLIIEQDKNSPHRYIDDYALLKNKILFDIGAAEGIFALDTIDYVSHAYLFECNHTWKPALLKTFSPWKEKVTIIEKGVSDRDSGAFISIDSFLKDKNLNRLFVKMDIEGYEEKALQGMKNTLLHTPDIYLAVCTYHQPEDPGNIAAFFEDLNYKYEFTCGSLFFRGRIADRVLLRSWNTY